MSPEVPRSRITETTLQPFTFAWFVVGATATIYYALVLQGLALLSRSSFWWTALHTTGAMLVVFYLLLELGYRGSKRSSGPLVQLRLNSLFLWITAAAFCVSLLRSYVVAFAGDRTTIQVSDVVGAVIMFLGATLLSTPFVVWFGSTLMWTATKILRLPRVRQFVQRWRGASEHKS